jgi:hypothetical protein
MADQVPTSWARRSLVSGQREVWPSIDRSWPAQGWWRAGQRHACQRDNDWAVSIVLEGGNACRVNLDVADCQVTSGE